MSVQSSLSAINNVLRATRSETLTEPVQEAITVSAVKC